MNLTYWRCEIKKVEKSLVHSYCVYNLVVRICFSLFRVWVSFLVEPFHTLSLSLCVSLLLCGLSECICTYVHARCLLSFAPDWSPNRMNWFALYHRYALNVSSLSSFELNSIWSMRGALHFIRIWRNYECARACLQCCYYFYRIKCYAKLTKRKQWMWFEFWDKLSRRICI